MRLYNWFATVAIVIAFFGLTVVPTLSATPRKTTTVSVPTPTPSPSPTPTVAPVDAYTLFWPIAPGKVTGDSLYSLKTFKETVREFFIFGDVKKSEYNITLSEKRIVEADYLFMTKKDYTNAAKTLDEAQKRREKARDIYIKAKAQKATGDLQNKLILSLEKQKSLLMYLATQVPEDQKQIIEDNLAKLTEVLMSVQ